MPIFEIWDYWTDGDFMYAIYYKNGELYFSEYPIPENLRGLKEENGE